jgi:hypothetical protein
MLTGPGGEKIGYAPIARPPEPANYYYLSMMASTSRAESTRYSSPEYFTSVPPYLLYSTTLGSRVVEATRAHRKDFALLGLLLGGVRDHKSGRGGLLRLKRADHDSVFERLDYYFGGGRHNLTSPSGKANGEIAREGERGRLSSRVPDCLVALALYMIEC